MLGAVYGYGMIGAVCVSVCVYTCVSKEEQESETESTLNPMSEHGAVTTDNTMQCP